jgi:Fic family protein
MATRTKTAAVSGSAPPREYQASHPWITFHIDLNRCDHEIWMLLGEISSRCDHIAGIPLLPETAKRLYTVYLSKGAAATTAIEGNTLSEAEVMQRVEGQLELPKSREYLGVEIDNIVRACNEINRAVALGETLELTPERIKHFNREVLLNLDLEEGVVPGECRHHNVGVARYRGTPLEDCEHLLERLCTWLNSLKLDDNHSKNMRFALSVLKAIIAHVYIAWIHPFGDGNGRTARLVEVQLLLQSRRVPVPAAFILSNHYNQTRDKYYRELDRSSKSGGDLWPFIKYAAEGFVDGLKEQLSYIREQQLDVTWRNFVHSKFDGKETKTAERQRRLVLDMPQHPVKRGDLVDVSTRVARAYADKTERTLSRDLNELMQLQLIVRTPKGFITNRQQILAWMPAKSK